MIFINNKFLIFIRALLLSLLIIGFLIFDGNIERLFLISLTLIIINILKCVKFKINLSIMIFIGLIVGYILGNIVLYYSIISINNNNYDDKNNKRYENKLVKPAVVIFSGGEPYKFESFTILENIYEQKSVVKKINAPIEVFKYKIAYENMGNSKYVDLCNRIEENLNLRLGTDYDLYSVYFNIDPNIYEEIDKLSKQYEKLILVPLMLSESKEYKKFKNTIDEKYLNSDTDIKITPLLWKSQKLARQILDKSIKVVNQEKIYSTGIILLISNEESFYDQSIFSNEVLRRMQRSKFPKDKIISLKYNNQELFLQSIRKLKGKGANNVVVISISSLHEDIREQYEMKELIKKIEKKESIKIHYISGWGIGENLLNELEYKIRITNLKN